MAAFADGKIEAFVGPAELGASDDIEQAICRFIAEADDSLDIAVQELDSEAIAQSILDARYRGVDVRMFLEQDYLVDSTLPRVPKPKEGQDTEEVLHDVQWGTSPHRSLDENRRIFTALLRSAVDVKADYNPAIFHQKFIVRDYREEAKPTTAILSGSANFTETDSHNNLNHVVVFHDYRIAGEYRREFSQIRSGQFGRGMHGEVPRTYNLNGVPVKVLFAPDHTPELEIMKQMLKARERVDFAIFTFAGSSGIDDAMIALAAADREITGTMDPAQGDQEWAATHDLHDAQIKLYFPRKVEGFGKLHHKLMVIDESTVLAGSFNYTAPANEYNDENIFVIGSPYPELPKTEGGPVDPDACAELARFFRTEIERIESVSDRWEPPA
jgi:phosphatidylserine/phosphatidylglycerophosphate/cardiolipin synthase-like enzyme